MSSCLLALEASNMELRPVCLKDPVLCRVLDPVPAQALGYGSTVTQISGQPSSQSAFLKPEPTVEFASMCISASYLPYSAYSIPHKMNGLFQTLKHYAKPPPNALKFDVLLANSF